VHGHTPIWEGKPHPAEPELLEHRTNIDTGAFATGVLTVAVFDAEAAGGPVEVLKVQGEGTAARMICDVPERDGRQDAPRRRRGLAGWLARRAGEP
jgi:hypothetical protein